MLPDGFLPKEPAWLLWLCTVASTLLLGVSSLVLLLKRYQFPLNRRWSGMILAQNALLCIWLLVCLWVPHLQTAPHSPCQRWLWLHAVFLGGATGIYLQRTWLIVTRAADSCQSNMASGRRQSAWAMRRQVIRQVINTSMGQVILACCILMINFIIPIVATASHRCDALLFYLTPLFLVLWPVPFIFWVSFRLNALLKEDCYWLKMELVLFSVISLVGALGVSLVIREAVEGWPVVLSLAVCAVVCVTTVYPLRLLFNRKLPLEQLRAVNMEQVLRNKTARDAFALHLSNELSTELLLYWEAVEAIRPQLLREIRKQESGNPSLTLAEDFGKGHTNPTAGPSPPPVVTKILLSKNHHSFVSNTSPSSPGIQAESKTPAGSSELPHVPSAVFNSPSTPVAVGCLSFFNGRDQGHRAWSFEHVKPSRRHHRWKISRPWVLGRDRHSWSQPTEQTPLPPLDYGLRDLYSKFIAPTALFPINISDQLLSKTQQLLEKYIEDNKQDQQLVIEQLLDCKQEGKITPSCKIPPTLAKTLCQTQAEVLSLMELGSLPRFLVTPQAAIALVGLFHGSHPAYRPVCALSPASPGQKPRDWSLSADASLSQTKEGEEQRSEVEQRSGGSQSGSAAVGTPVLATPVPGALRTPILRSPIPSSALSLSTSVRDRFPQTPLILRKALAMATSSPIISERGSLRSRLPLPLPPHREHSYSLQLDNSTPDFSSISSFGTNMFHLGRLQSIEKIQAADDLVSSQSALPVSEVLSSQTLEELVAPTSIIQGASRKESVSSSTLSQSPTLTNAITLSNKQDQDGEDTELKRETDTTLSGRPRSMTDGTELSQTDVGKELSERSFFTPSSTLRKLKSSGRLRSETKKETTEIGRPRSRTVTDTALTANSFLTPENSIRTLRSRSTTLPTRSLNKDEVQVMPTSKTQNSSPRKTDQQQQQQQQADAVEIHATNSTHSSATSTPKSKHREEIGHFRNANTSDSVRERRTRTRSSNSSLDLTKPPQRANSGSNSSVTPSAGQEQFAFFRNSSAESTRKHSQGKPSNLRPHSTKVHSRTLSLKDSQQCMTTPISTRVISASSPKMRGQGFGGSDVNPTVVLQDPWPWNTIKGRFQAPFRLNTSDSVTSIHSSPGVGASRITFSPRAEKGFIISSSQSSPGPSKRHSSPPSYPSELPKRHSSPPCYPSELPKRHSSPLSYPSELPKRHSSPPSYPSELPKRHSSPPSHPSELPKRHSSPPSYPSELPLSSHAFSSDRLLVSSADKSPSSTARSALTKSPSGQMRRQSPTQTHLSSSLPSVPVVPLTKPPSLKRDLSSSFPTVFFGSADNSPSSTERRSLAQFPSSQVRHFKWTKSPSPEVRSLTMKFSPNQSSRRQTPPDSNSLPPVGNPSRFVPSADMSTVAESETMENMPKSLASSEFELQLETPEMTSNETSPRSPRSPLK
eukprot:g25644.t1